MNLPANKLRAFGLSSQYFLVATAASVTGIPGLFADTDVGDQAPRDGLVAWPGRPVPLADPNGARLLHREENPWNKAWVSSVERGHEVRRVDWISLSRNAVNTSMWLPLVIPDERVLERLIQPPQVPIWSLGSARC